VRGSVIGRGPRDNGGPAGKDKPGGGSINKDEVAWASTLTSPSCRRAAAANSSKVDGGVVVTIRSAFTIELCSKMHKGGG
jgi:hypothetical protein